MLLNFTDRALIHYCLYGILRVGKWDSLKNISEIFDYYFSFSHCTLVYPKNITKSYI